MALTPEIMGPDANGRWSAEWTPDDTAEGYAWTTDLGTGRTFNPDIAKISLGTRPAGVTPTFKISALDVVPRPVEIAPDPNAPPPPPPPPSGVLPRYGGATGFVIQGSGSTDASIASELDKWKDIGCQILRVDLLESTAYQAKFTTIMNGCHQRGMKIMACLRGTSGPYGANAAGLFAKQMATKYGTQVEAYEYVNEPNLGGPRYSPTAYGPELAAVYAAIKSVDSNLLVATCGMGWDGAGKFSNWWPAAYNSGGKDHFDLFNVHLYNAPDQGNWTEAFNVHATYGQGKPFISTEGGAKGTAQKTVIPAGLKDPRIMTMCTYNMTLEVAGFNLWPDVGGYTAYKNLPKT
jgi:hypothetical protein